MYGGPSFSWQNSSDIRSSVTNSIGIFLKTTKKKKIKNKENKIILPKKTTIKTENDGKKQISKNSKN